MCPECGMPLKRKHSRNNVSYDCENPKCRVITVKYRYYGPFFDGILKVKVAAAH